MTWHSFLARARRSFDSRPVRITAAVLLGLCSVLVIFGIGVQFGLHQARSSYRWGESYQRNFGGPEGGFFMHAGIAANGNGVFGRVASTSGNSFIIADPRHPEQAVRIASSTVIHKGSQDAPASDLAVGTFVVVIGIPREDGVIDATLIRIMPDPPAAAPLTTK